MAYRGAVALALAWMLLESVPICHAAALVRGGDGEMVGVRRQGEGLRQAAGAPGSYAADRSNQHVVTVTVDNNQPLRNASGMLMVRRRRASAAGSVARAGLRLACAGVFARTRAGCSRTLRTDVSCGGKQTGCSGCMLCSTGCARKR